MLLKRNRQAFIILRDYNFRSHTSRAIPNGCSHYSLCVDFNDEFVVVASVPTLIHRHIRITFVIWRDQQTEAEIFEELSKFQVVSRKDAHSVTTTTVSKINIGQSDTKIHVSGLFAIDAQTRLRLQCVSCSHLVRSFFHLFNGIFIRKLLPPELDGVGRLFFLFGGGGS